MFQEWSNKTVDSRTVYVPLPFGGIKEEFDYEQTFKRGINGF
jgi:hypothetical protein